MNIIVDSGNVPSIIYYLYVWLWTLFVWSLTSSLFHYHLIVNLFTLTSMPCISWSFDSQSVSYFSHKLHSSVTGYLLLVTFTWFLLDAIVFYVNFRRHNIIGLGFWLWQYFSDCLSQIGTIKAKNNSTLMLHFWLAPLLISTCCPTVLISGGLLSF